MTACPPYYSFLFLTEEDLSLSEDAHSLQPPPVSVCVSLVVTCYFVHDVWIDPSNVGPESIFGHCNILFRDIIERRLSSLMFCYAFVLSTVTREGDLA